MSDAGGPFLYGIYAWIGFAAASMAGIRIARPRTPMAFLAANAVAIFMVFMIIFAMAGARFNIWPTAAIYGAGCSIYLFLFAGFYKSISLKILLSVSAANERQVPMKHIIDDIALREGLPQRIDLLCEMGYAERKNTAITLSERGRRLARKICYLQSLYGIRAGG